MHRSNEFHILVVEDDEDATRSVLRFLGKIDKTKFSLKENADVKIRHAKDQSEADREVEHAPLGGFDLIILDLKYPGGQADGPPAGMQWLPQLRKLQPHAAIAIQTAYPDDNQMYSAVEALRDYGADEFIPKGALWRDRERRFAVAWEHALDRRYNGFLKTGYRELMQSRVFLIIAEEARDEVYRRSADFRDIALRLQNVGQTVLAEELVTEYAALKAQVEDITKHADAVRALTAEQTDMFDLLEGLKIFYGPRSSGGSVSVVSSSHVPIIVQSAHFVITTYKNDLRLALHELIENALEATKEKMQKLGTTGGSVTLHATESPGGAEIRIWDSGEGFSAERLDNPPRRNDKSSKDASNRPRGNGLFVAFHSINRIFGSVTLANRPEGGGEVRISLRNLARNVETS